MPLLANADPAVDRPHFVGRSTAPWNGRLTLPRDAPKEQHQLLRRAYDTAGRAPRSKGSAGGLYVHRHARCVPKALNIPKCTTYAKCRHLSVAAFTLGARSPRTRPRARALSSKKYPGSPRWEDLEQKFANLLLSCAQWTHPGRGIFQYFGDQVTQVGPVMICEPDVGRI